MQLPPTPLLLLHLAAAAAMQAGCTRCRTVVSAVDDNWRLGQLDHKRGLRIVVNPLAGTSSAIARFVCFTRVFTV